MAARTGAEYIKGLQAQDHEVWLRGERVKDVTTHPGLANGVRAIASLYDQLGRLRDAKKQAAELTAKAEAGSAIAASAGSTLCHR